MFGNADQPGEAQKMDIDFLQEALQQRLERLEESEASGQDGDRRPSPKERLSGSALEVAENVREMLKDVPDVRRDRVEEIKKQLQEGSLKFDSKSVAERFLQETILNEML